MNLIQKVKGDQDNFGEVATVMLSMALEDGSMSQRIDSVFDTNKDTSIKNSERLAMGEVLGLGLKSITASQILRQWRIFFTMSGTNRASFHFWSMNGRRPSTPNDYREKLFL